MILVVGLLTLLVATSTGAQRIKGATAVLQGVGGGPVVVGKGGGLGGVHHAAVVEDPISGSPVVVSNVGGIKTAGLGGVRPVYRVGQSQIPFGLLGSDYFSYPNSLLTAPRALRTKSVIADNLSGLSPVGAAVIADPGLSQFSVGDAQIKTSVFGARRPIYRTGISSVPFGILGSDYFSYPNSLLTQRPVSLGLGGIKTAPVIAGLGAHYGGYGTRQVAIPAPAVVHAAPAVVHAAPAPVRVVQAAPAPVRVVQAAPAPVRVVQAAPAPVQVVHAAPAPIVHAAPAPVRVVQAAPAPVRIVQAAPAPVRVVQAAPMQYAAAPAPVQIMQAPFQRRVIQRAPVQAFLSHIAQPQVATIARPAPVAYAAGPAGFGNMQFTLGGNQLYGGPIVAAAPAVHAIHAAPAVHAVHAAPVIAPRPMIAAAPRQIFAAPRQVIAAPAPVRVVQAAPAPVQVVHAAPAPVPVVHAAPAPVRVVQAAPAPVRVVQAAPAPVRVVQAAPAPVQVVHAAPAPVPVIQAAPAPVVVSRPQVISKTNLGSGIIRSRPSQLIYLDGGNRFPGIDIIGGSRIGDPRFGYTQLPISTTRFANMGIAPVASKIGGLATGGLAGIAGPTKVITQEQVVGPAGDPQVITTVTSSDPVQEHLTDAALGSGHTQVHIDDGIGSGGITQVKETLVAEPLTGEVHKVTQVTKQHDIGDTIMQESIPSGLGGLGALRRFSPRISFLSSYPYDAPDSGLLRSVISSPVIQQHQVEQIHVR